jgi:hypothetical protein
MWDNARMQPESHRVWRYAGLAWLLLIAIPTASAAIFWRLGIGRDPDISGAGELLIMILLFLLVPAAVLAFAVLAPLAVGVDRLVRGRTPRSVNLLIGLALAASVVAAGMLAFPPRGFTPVGRALLSAMPFAGMIVGLGLRHRRSASRPGE